MRGADAKRTPKPSEAKWDQVIAWEMGGRKDSRYDPPGEKDTNHQLWTWKKHKERCSATRLDKNDLKGAK